MNLTAVICEFNPFHNGHAYLLEEARRVSGCDALVCVMSGNFVQRARPAIADMRLRAEAALLNGADAVIELPVLYASSCGEKFSEGAVNIINSLPSVTHLAFGSESGNLEYLQKVAKIQSEESENFKKNLKRLLDDGQSYAAALSQATEAELGGTAPKLPNDLLATEYIKQLLLTNSKIRPVAVTRTGAGYHDKHTAGAFASATAIRGFYETGNFAAAEAAMPKSAFELLRPHFSEIRTKRMDEYFDMLVIEALRNRGLSDCPDAGCEGLDIKLKKAALQFTDLDKIVAAAKSKRYTEARIRRLALQALLCVTHYPDLSGFLLPAKLIGVRQAVKNDLLRELPKNITVQNKDFDNYIPALVPKDLKAAEYIWKLNKTAANIYSLITGRDGEFYDAKPLLTV